MAPKRRPRAVNLKALEPKRVMKGGNVRYLVDVPKTMGGARLRMFFRTVAAAQDFIADKMRLAACVGHAAFASDSGKVLAEAVEQFLPRLDERSDSHRGNAQRVLEVLVARYGGVAVSDISPLMLDDWLRRRKNENTRARDFRYIRMFFRWAYRMELIEKNPVDRLESPRTTPSRVLMTPEQMVDLLALEMPDWTRAHILLGGFAGLRTEEMMRMDWGAVDFDSGEIHVGQGVQKDSGGWRERYVDFMPPISRLLKSSKGKIVPVGKTRLFVERRRLVKQLGWQGWPDNALRHSFASYHLALCGDASKTAHQMGHTSSAMVYRTYARAVKKSVAEKWWAIGAGRE